jgi:hypothetical protein
MAVEDTVEKEAVNTQLMRERHLAPSLRNATGAASDRGGDAQMRHVALGAQWRTHAAVRL